MTAWFTGDIVPDICWVPSEALISDGEDPSPVSADTIMYSNAISKYKQEHYFFSFSRLNKKAY